MVMVSELYDNISNLEKELFNNSDNSNLKRLCVWLLSQLKDLRPNNIKLHGWGDGFIDFSIGKEIYIINGRESYYPDTWLKYIGICIRILGVDGVISNITD